MAATAVWRLFLAEDRERSRAWAAPTKTVLEGLAGEPLTGVALLDGVELFRRRAAVAERPLDGSAVGWLGEAELRAFPRS